MNKKIIWDLFGGGQNSIYNALKEANKLEEYEVYTFDITKPTRKKHYKLDLTQPNIVEVFKYFPHPDIIVASPMCSSFSAVLTLKGGGTPFWKYNDSKTKLIDRSVEEFEWLRGGFTSHLRTEQQLESKRIGKLCIDNTIELIKAYKPKQWYIENPRGSLMWKYITLNRDDFYNESMFLNKASYGKYGFPTNKPTIFLSNVELELLNGKTEKPYNIIYENGVKWLQRKDDLSIKTKWGTNAGFSRINPVKSESGGRSAIPYELIISIINQLEGEENE